MDSTSLFFSALQMLILATSALVMRRNNSFYDRKRPYFVKNSENWKIKDWKVRLIREFFVYLQKKRKMKTDTKTKKPERKSVFLKLVEDKKAISECIRMGGDLSKLAKERGLKFAKPL